MEKFEELAIENVKEACHSYLLNKDMDYIVQKRADIDIPIFGINVTELKGMQLLNEHYNSKKVSDSICVVTIRNEMGVLSDSCCNVIIDGTFVCTLINDEIRFNAIHFSKSTTSPQVIRTETNVVDDYRRAINYMYDVVLEYQYQGNTFTYDPEKYNQLFELNTNFVSMDQWFWHMCTYCLHSDDSELLDVFRSNDISKRIQNDSCVVMDDIRIKNKEKGYIWVRMVIVFIPNHDKTNLEGVLVMFKNIDEEKNKQMEYIRKARRDILTGLWNRFYFENTLKNYFADGNTSNGVFLIVDIDNFKSINDMFGHITGDQVLKLFAQQIYDSIGENNLCARLGGDEFIVFICNIQSLEQAKKRVEDLHHKLQSEYCEQEIHVMINCSIGAVLNNNSCDINQLYEKADKNLYAAKRSGKNTICVTAFEE